MTQNDRLSDDVIDDLLLGADELFGEGGFTGSKLESVSLLSIDEEDVKFVMSNKDMSEGDARKYVHDTRHLMREMGVADTTKINFSLMK